MKYHFDPSKVNRQDVNMRNFGYTYVGYILPDGSIYKAPKTHSWSDLETIFFQTVVLISEFFRNHETYSKKELEEMVNAVIEKDGPDKMINLVSNYLKNLVLSENGKEKFLNLASSVKLIKRENRSDIDKSKLPEKQGDLIFSFEHKAIYFKEFLVCGIGCHSISGIDMEIATAAPNYKELFEEYIEGGCKIVPVPRVEYSDEQHKFVIIYHQKEETIPETTKSEVIRFHEESLKNPPHFTYYGDYTGETDEPKRLGK